MINKTFYFIVFLLIVNSSFCQGPYFNWVTTFGGDTTDTGLSIVVDNNGDIYVCGQFGGVVDFNGLPTEYLFMTSNGEHDFFIQKMNSNRELIWVRTFGGEGDDSAESLTIDKSGNIYVTGYFTGIVDFDPSIQEFNLTSEGETDVFVQKLNNDGDLLWVINEGGSMSDAGLGVVSDSLNNVYVTGYFQGMANFNLSYTSNGEYDIFVQKIDSSGVVIWTNTYGGVSSDIGNDITIDNEGFLYLCGNFEETVDFNPSVVVGSLVSNGWTDAFMQKLNTEGDVLWTKSFGGSSKERCLSIKTDLYGNVYSTGEFHETVNFNTGSGMSNFTTNGALDIYIQKLDTAGEYIWTETFGGELTDIGSTVTLDSKGDVYIAGLYQSNVDFNNGNNNAVYSANGIWDAFILNIGSQGDFNWVKTFGGQGSNEVNSIFVDSSNNVYATGGFINTVDFDPDNGSTIYTSVNTRDAFVLKLSETLGINEKSLINEIIIYPNPSNDFLNVSIPNDKFYLIRLVNVYGEVVLEELIDGLKLKMNIEKLNSGLYIVQIVAADKILKGTFIKV